MMDWLQILAMILGNAAWILPMFFWNRAESRSDMRHMDTKYQSLIQSIHDEMKDFHERLIRIEEKYAQERSKIILEELRRK